MTLSLQAIHAALDDCGIEAKDVDGLLRWQVDTSAEAEVAASLGIKELKYFGDITQAGNVGAALVANASAAINAGLAETKLSAASASARDAAPAPAIPSPILRISDRRDICMSYLQGRLTERHS
jgi:hypothetical protein